MLTRGREYLYNRHVTDAEIREFRICYCDESVNLSSLFDIPTLWNSFLWNRDGRPDPKFVDSIIIPVFSVYGHIQGLYCRKLNPASSKNRHDGTSWIKMDHLFCLDKSWSHALERQSIYLVEGPFDAIACWKHGYKNVVSVMGTNVSANHACLLSRFVTKAYLVFDNDKAGIKAVYDTTNLLTNFGIECQTIQLKKDPDEVLAEDPTALLRRALL